MRTEIIHAPIVVAQRALRLQLSSAGCFVSPGLGFTDVHGKYVAHGGRSTLGDILGAFWEDRLELIPSDLPSRVPQHPPL